MPRGAGRWTSNNSFKPARRWQQDVIGHARPVIRVVQGHGHPVHRNDLECLPFEVQVDVAISRSVHKTPELALARSNLYSRPHGPVYRHDLLWRFWLRTTGIRTEFNPMLQIGRLRIVHNGTATHNQDALRQAR